MQLSVYFESTMVAFLSWEDDELEEEEEPSEPEALPESEPPDSAAPPASEVLPDSPPAVEELAPDSPLCSPAPLSPAVVPLTLFAPPRPLSAIALVALPAPLRKNWRAPISSPRSSKVSKKHSHHGHPQHLGHNAVHLSQQFCLLMGSMSRFLESDPTTSGSQ